MIKLLGIGSSPRSGDRHAMHESLSSILLQDVLEAAREVSEDCETEIVQLARLNIHPCRGCFSDIETRCHYLCDCYDDDFAAVAEKIIQADGVVFATPTYMFGMSGILRQFLERWISFKAPPVPRETATKSLDESFDLMDRMARGTLTVDNPLQGKVAGIVVAGSELGQDNAAREIMLVLNLYGFIIPPQAFIYHTGHSMQSLEAVRESFFDNEWLAHAIEKLARTMVRLIELTKGHQWPRMPGILRGV
jgi:multimeric flavodoxin WrbA